MRNSRKEVPVGDYQWAALAELRVMFPVTGRIPGQFSAGLGILARRDLGRVCLGAERCSTDLRKESNRSKFDLISS